MIVKIDKMGRITVPKKYREEFNLKPDSEANMLPLPDGIGVSLFRLAPKCANCGEEEGLEKFDNLSLCGNCKKILKYAIRQ